MMPSPSIEHASISTARPQSSDSVKGSRKESLDELKMKLAALKEKKKEKKKKKDKTMKKMKKAEKKLKKLQKKTVMNQQSQVSCMERVRL